MSWGPQPQPEGNSAEAWQTYQIPLLSPFPPRIPPELVGDTEFHDKIHVSLTLSNITLMVSMTLFIGWVVFLNGIVVLGFYSKREEKKHAADIYMINMGIADFLVGIFVLPLMGADVVIGYFPFGNFLCQFWIYWDYFLIVISAFISAALLYVP
jgi:hypothetical protein